jgi:hypothetical protein
MRRERTALDDGTVVIAKQIDWSIETLVNAGYRLRSLTLN